MSRAARQILAWCTHATERLLGGVAAASLAAQQRFDDRAEQRRAAAAASRPLPSYPGTVARLAVVLSIGALVGVQVLGIGRPGTPDDAPPLATTATEPAAEPSVPPDRDGADGSPEAPSIQASPIEAPAIEAPLIVQAARPAPPATLRIPAIEVDAAVVPVGLEADGAMEIPADVRTVGWYDPFAGSGLSPGEPGTAVIAGHVDSRVQGRGAFWFLRDLEVGDIVEVVHEDGDVSRWRIESVVRYPKDDIPIEEIFAFDGPPRIALITCGGEFDRSISSYLENYVVTAVPLVLANPTLQSPATSSLS